MHKFVSIEQENHIKKLTIAIKLHNILLEIIYLLIFTYFNPTEDISRVLLGAQLLIN